MCAFVASPRLCPQSGETALDMAGRNGGQKEEVAELLRTWTRG